MNYGAFLLSIRPAFIGSILKKVLLVRRKVVSTNHGNFFVDPATIFGVRLIVDGEYEPLMIETVEGVLKKGGVFVDLGANEGYFSVIASQVVGDEGRVVAIEPQGRLQEVIALNSEMSANSNSIELQKVAISDVDGFADLYLAPSGILGSSGLFNQTNYKNPTEKVFQLTLATLVSRLNISNIDLLKIDIEGFEYEAILGSKELFSQGRVRNIALELHDSTLFRRGKKMEDITRFLESCGYFVNLKYRNLVYTKG